MMSTTPELQPGRILIQCTIAQRLIVTIQAISMALLGHFPIKSLFWYVFPGIRLSPLTPQVHTASSLPFDPGRITESVLLLSDMAVLLTRQQREVLYCSNSIVGMLGIKSERVRQEGWPYLYSCIHPADQKLLEKKGWPLLKKFLRRLPASDRGKCTFNYTARVGHGKRGYQLIAFENQPMEWIKGNWHDMYMTVLKNITPYGNKEKMLLTVSRQDSNGRYDVIHEHGLDFTYDPFTRREAEVIRMVATGLTSNQMADQLKLSVETVRNHRKHILKKAKCSSSTELTSFAIENGII